MSRSCCHAFPSITKILEPSTSFMFLEPAFAIMYCVICSAIHLVSAILVSDDLNLCSALLVVGDHDVCLSNGEKVVDLPDGDASLGNVKGVGGFIKCALAPAEGDEVLGINGHAGGGVAPAANGDDLFSFFGIL